MILLGLRARPHFDADFSPHQLAFRTKLNLPVRKPGTDTHILCLSTINRVMVKPLTRFKEPNLSWSAKTDTSCHCQGHTKVSTHLHGRRQ